MLELEFGKVYNITVINTENERHRPVPLGEWTPAWNMELGCFESYGWIIFSFVFLFSAHS